MDIIIEILLFFFGEAILQLIFEGIFGGIAKSFKRQKPKKTRTNISEWVTQKKVMLLSYAFFGALAGFISVALIHGHITPNIQIRTINLIVTPLVIGEIMTLFGVIPEDQEFESVRRDRFLPAYIFALAMALIRFFFAK